MINRLQPVITFDPTDSRGTLVLIHYVLLRILYYVQNWVYTTNHKRIAVNYF